MDASLEKNKKIEKELLRLPSISTDRNFTTDSSKIREEINKENPTKERWHEYHNLIQNHIGSLNTDIDSVLQRHEQDFLNAFKCQMYNLYTQIKDLKKASNSTGVSLKHNEEIHKLQKLLEKSQQESLKLNQIAEEYKEKYEELEKKAKELESDCKFFKSRLKTAKKKIKILKSPAENHDNINQTLITAIETHSPPPIYPIKFIPSSKSGEIISEILKKYKRPDTQLFKDIEEVMEKQAKHFLESSKHYQSIISNEKKKIQNLSVMQTSVFLEKSELENLFLDCVEEVKKEIGHRRAKSLRQQKFPLKSKSPAIEKAETFSPADKRKIMEMLISNEQVLIMLYEKLFPFRASQFGNQVKNEQFTSFDNTVPDLEELMKSIPASLPNESSITVRSLRDE